MYNDSNVTIQHPRPYHLTAIPSPDSSTVADRLSQLNHPMPAMNISPPLLHSQGFIVGSKSGGDPSTDQIYMFPPAGADDSCPPAYSPRETLLGFDPLGFLNLRERDAHHDLAFQLF
jgi:hypothetical protein